MRNGKEDHSRKITVIEDIVKWEINKDRVNDAKLTIMMPRSKKKKDWWLHESDSFTGVGRMK